MTTEISLPRTQVPIFPRRCAVSGESAPDSFLSMKVHSLSWSSTASASNPDAVDEVRVPVNSVHRNRLRWQLRLHSSLFLIYVVVGATVASNVDTWLGTDFSRLETLLITGFCISPLIALQFMLPAAVSVRAVGDRVVYEFRSADYACEFEQLNSRAG